MDILTFVFIIIGSSLLIFFIYLTIKEFVWVFYGKIIVQKIIKTKIDKNIVNIFFLRDDDKRIKPIYIERNLSDHIPGFNTNAKKEYYVKVDFMEEGKIKNLIVRVDYRVFKKIKINIFNTEDDSNEL